MSDLKLHTFKLKITERIAGYYGHSWSRVNYYVLKHFKHILSNLVILGCTVEHILGQSGPFSQIRSHMHTKVRTVTRKNFSKKFLRSRPTKIMKNTNTGLQQTF